MFDRLCDVFPGCARHWPCTSRKWATWAVGRCRRRSRWRGFLSLFPLLLLGISVVGFVASDRTDYADQVIDNLGLTGRAAEQVLDVIHNAEDVAAPPR